MDSNSGYSKVAEAVLVMCLLCSVVHSTHISELMTPTPINHSFLCFTSTEWEARRVGAPLLGRLTAEVLPIVKATNRKCFELFMGSFHTQSSKCQ